MSVALGIQIVTTYLQYNPKKEKNEAATQLNFFLTPVYLWCQVGQVLAYNIFLLSKYPKDFFKYLSKMQNIKYSIFQKKRYIYAD
jgi:hypothetical protein